MSNKNKIIIAGIFLITLTFLSIIYICFPKITIKLEGDKIIELNTGEEYKEYGATATLKTLFKRKNIKVDIKGKVNNNKIGKYIITYAANSKYLNAEIIRIVNIKDMISPKINLKSKIIGCKNNKLIQYDIEAIDNYDGNITNNVKYEIKDNKIIFFVKDSSKNEGKIIEKITYIDEEKPKIKLNGKNTIYLKIGEQYEEYGATAFDSCDGDLTNLIEIQSNVNTNIPGTYEIIYTVKDKNQKSTNLKRYIIVSENETDYNKYQVVNGATIYLTFDDGPGKYTEEILNILKEADIKATFFVTGQFPKYQNLIKREYEEGHSIGIHTYSHKWSVYESVESYLEDFRKMENIIYNETGVYTKLFRFPGGSSNTISKNYSKGIITTLATKLESEGYTYFDWNFDSGDTNKKDNSVDKILHNFKINLKGDGEYIVLMHDIKENTLKALPKIIQFAQSNGYKFANLTETSPTAHLKIVN